MGRKHVSLAARQRVARFGCLVLAASALSLLAFPTDAVAGTVVLQENFESGAPGWTMTGFWHIQDHPENIAVTSPGINPNLVTLPDAGQLPTAFEGSMAAWFGEAATGTFCGSDWATVNSGASKNGCSSSTPYSGALTSPTFSLAGVSSAQVTFAGWYEIEAVAADGFDLMRIEYSTDGGSTWVSTGSLNPVNNPAGSHDQSYSNNGLEQSPSWRQYLIDLSGAAGQPNVQIRIVFDTVDTLYQGFRGLLVDQLTVSTPFEGAAPAISSLEPPCVNGPDSATVVVHGSNFVVGSEVLLDGGSVGGAVESSERMEFSAPPGTHTVSVRTPNGAQSNEVELCPPPPPPPPPPPMPPPRPGPAPIASPNLASLSFGDRLVGGTPVTETLTITNTGTAPLTFSSVSLEGPDATAFAVASSTCGGGVTPGQSCALAIRFSPNAARAQTATLVLNDNAPDSPQRVPLSGSGLPPPVLFKNVNAEPISGTVLVAVPGASAGATTRVHGTQSLKGLKFVPLEQARQVPIGSFFDTTRGTVEIVTAKTEAGATQTGQFFAGIFQTLQRRSQKGIADAKLAGGSFSSCARAGKANDAHKRLSKKTIRRLSANVKGRYRTSGKYASATVRGTEWTMTDRCDGTLTKVRRGTVVVRDLARRRNITVHRGKSVLVPAP